MKKRNGSKHLHFQSLTQYLDRCGNGFVMKTKHYQTTSTQGQCFGKIPEKNKSVSGLNACVCVFLCVCACFSMSGCACFHVCACVSIWPLSTICLWPWCCRGTSATTIPWPRGPLSQSATVLGETQKVHRTILHPGRKAVQVLLVGGRWSTISPPWRWEGPIPHP